jgi:hypothetical protein
MLTGQPALGGEDITTTLARMLEREANTTAVRATVPAAARHTIELCLQKDVNEDVADVVWEEYLLHRKLLHVGTN